VASTIGVVGAGTMGSGIAQLAALAGARTLVHDAIPEGLARGIERLRGGLEKGAERGRWSAEEASAAADRVQPVDDLEALAPCALVIEAIAESLEAKRELFTHLAAIIDPACVLATNTSSLSVTDIAAAVPGPERVVGMHFFNPAPLMRLLEVIAGELSSEEALALARGTGEAMGKRVIVASDGPGFLVNRCGRPFGLEAQRVVVERLASIEQVDRICRLGGGFRMGPFELSDLVGVDVGFEVSKSFYAQSFGEPRWRPTLLAGRLAASGRHGRKAGRGWYDYSADPPWPPDPAPPATGGGDGLVVVAGEGVVAAELADLARGAGWRVATPTRWTRRDRAAPAPSSAPRDRSAASTPRAAPRASTRCHRWPPPGSSRQRAGRTRRCWPSSAPSTSSARSASTWSGWPTRRGSFSAGSSPSSSTRLRSPCARASARPRTSTPG
jgi:3-hydroxybutyryl-CoA dehydrogenase